MPDMLLHNIKLYRSLKDIINYDYRNLTIKNHIVECLYTIEWATENNLYETVINALPLTLIELKINPSKIDNDEYIYDIIYYKGRLLSLSNYYERDMLEKLKKKGYYLVFE